MIGTWRAISIFRGRGFGNPYINYCWTMHTYHGELYVGTMDHSYLLDDFLDLLISDPLMLIYIINIWLPQNIGPRNFGADLFKFTYTTPQAIAVSQDGMGNPINYGIRTMITNSSSLFLGTANPMNLSPQGGWELIELNSPQTRVPYVTGLTLEAARMLITQADLACDINENITYVDSDSVEGGKVIEQHPEGGVVLFPGNTVELVVSKKKSKLLPGVMMLLLEDER